jgi:hypothetical protein
VYAPNATFGVLRFDQAATYKVYSNGGNNLGAWFTLDTTNSVTPFGFDISMDVSHATRTTGAYVFNSNASLGTLGAAGLVIDQGTSSPSWHLLANPTLDY